VLDSLGLDTEVAIDPALPGFVLLVAHNPFRATAGSIGFLYWYRGADLRMQGVVVRGGRAPKMRVWYTAKEDGPYEWAIVDHGGADDHMNLLLLRLNAEGYFWTMVQYEGVGPDLGGVGSA